jgi:hypothetical protein
MLVVPARSSQAGNGGRELKMGIARFIGRTVGAIVGLGVLAVVLVAGLPLFMMAIAAVAGAALLFTIGLPALIVAVLVAVAIGAVISTLFGLASFGILLLKLWLAFIVVSWLFRKVFGRSRRHEPMLVGAPIAEVSAPRRDKYEIEAERELDKELGL